MDLFSKTHTKPPGDSGDVDLFSKTYWHIRSCLEQLGFGVQGLPRRGFLPDDEPELEAFEFEPFEGAAFADAAFEEDGRDELRFRGRGVRGGR